MIHANTFSGNLLVSVNHWGKRVEKPLSEHLACLSTGESCGYTNTLFLNKGTLNGV